MYPPRAARDLHSPPGSALIVGNLHQRDIAGASGLIRETDPVSENPSSVGKNLDFLAAEGAGAGKQGLGRSPGISVVRGDLPADFCGVLQIKVRGILRRDGLLGGIDQPDLPARRKEKEGILLRAGGIVGDDLPHAPCAFPGLQSGNHDGDVRLSLVASREPAGQQIPVWKLRQIGRVDGRKLVGDQRLHRFRKVVVTEPAILRQDARFHVLSHKTACPFPKKLIIYIITI